MSITSEYDSGQFDDFYEICDREYDEEIHWDLGTLLDMAEELTDQITGLAPVEDMELIQYLGESLTELLNRFRGQGMGTREEEKLDKRLMSLFKLMADSAKQNGCDEPKVYETIANELEKARIALNFSGSEKIEIKAPEKLVEEAKEELDKEQLYRDACCYMDGRMTDAEKDAAIFKSLILKSSGEIESNNTWKENLQKAMPTRDSVYEAKQIFEQLGDYRDSKERYQICSDMKFGSLGLLVKGGRLFANAQKGDQYFFTIDDKIEVVVKIDDKTYSAEALGVLEGEHEVCVKKIVRLKGKIERFSPKPVKFEIGQYKPKVVIASNKVREQDTYLELEVVNGLI